MFLKYQTLDYALVVCDWINFLGSGSRYFISRLALFLFLLLINLLAIRT